MTDLEDRLNVRRGVKGFVTRDAETRFWEKVNKSEGCWVWTGASRHGYGDFWYQGRHWVANQVSWMWEQGPIPNGLHVLHHCDTPLCVRPSHLFVGSHSDNMADMARKGRTGKTAKLTPSDVRLIRAEAAGGTSQRALARRLGVNQGAIRKVLTGRTWVHVD